jgi:hypothetical protein
VQTSPRDDRRALIDAKLTELGLYAKELCPEGAVEMSTVRYHFQRNPLITSSDIALNHRRFVLSASLARSYYSLSRFSAAPALNHAICSALKLCWQRMVSSRPSAWCRITVTGLPGASSLRPTMLTRSVSCTLS